MSGGVRCEVVMACGHTSLHTNTHSLCLPTPTTSDPPSDVSLSCPPLVFIAGNVLMRWNVFGPSVEPPPEPEPFIVGSEACFYSCVQHSPDARFLAVGTMGLLPAVHLYDRTARRVASSEYLYLFDRDVIAIRWHPILPLLFVTGLRQQPHPGHSSDGALDPDSSAFASTASVLYKPTLCVLKWDQTQHSFHVLFRMNELDDLHAFDVSENGSFVAICHQKGISLCYFHLPNEGLSLLSSITNERVEVRFNAAKAPSTNFVSIVCGRAFCSAYIYALTKEGTLCAFTQRDLRKATGTRDSSNGLKPLSSYAWDIEKWVDLRMNIGYSLCLSCDSLRGIIGISGAEGKVRLFEPTGLSHIATLPKPPQLVALRDSKLNAPPHALSVLLSSDRTLAIVFYSNRVIVVWKIPLDVNSTPVTPLTQMAAHSGCIWDLTEVTDPATKQLTLFSCAADSTLGILDIPEHTTRSTSDAVSVSHTANTCSGSKFSLQACKMTKHLLSLTSSHFLGVSGNGFRILEWKSSTTSICEIAFLSLASQQSGAELTCLTYNEHDKVLAVGLNIGDILFCDVQNPTKPTWLFNVRIQRHSRAVTSIKYMSNCCNLVTISEDCTLSVHYKESNDIYKMLVRHSFPGIEPLSLIVHPNDHYFAVSCSDCKIRIFNASSGMEMFSYRGASNPLKNLCVDYTGQFLMGTTLDDDAVVRVLDWFSGKELAELRGHATKITAMRCSASAALLYTSSADGCIIVRKLTSSYSAQAKNLTTTRSLNAQLETPLASARSSKRSARAYIDQTCEEEKEADISLMHLEDSQAVSMPSDKAIKEQQPVWPRSAFGHPDVPGLDLASLVTRSPFQSQSHLPEWARTGQNIGSISLPNAEPAERCRATVGELESVNANGNKIHHRHSRWSNLVHSDLISDGVKLNNSAWRRSGQVITSEVVEPLASAVMPESAESSPDNESHTMVDQLYAPLRSLSQYEVDDAQQPRMLNEADQSLKIIDLESSQSPLVVSSSSSIPRDFSVGSSHVVPSSTKNSEERGKKLEVMLAPPLTEEQLGSLQLQKCRSASAEAACESSSVHQSDADMLVLSGEGAEHGYIVGEEMKCISSSAVDAAASTCGNSHQNTALYGMTKQCAQMNEQLVADAYQLALQHLQAHLHYTTKLYQQVRQYRPEIALDDYERQFHQFRQFLDSIVKCSQN